MGYDKGSLVRVAATFRNAANAVADPTTVTLQTKTPAEVTTTYTYGVGGVIVKDSTGVYHADIELTEDGQWFYRWRGAGGVTAADEGTFTTDTCEF